MGGRAGAIPRFFYPRKELIIYALITPGGICAGKGRSKGGLL